MNLSDCGLGSRSAFAQSGGESGGPLPLEATLTYTSPHVEDGVLDIKIQAASVNTGSGVKDGKLKSKDFFDVEQDPYITFHSTKVVQPETYLIVPTGSESLGY